MAKLATLQYIATLPAACSCTRYMQRMAALQDACPHAAELSRPSKVLCGEGSDGAGAAGEAPEPISGVHVPGELPRWISERIRTVRDGANSSAGAHAAGSSRRAPGGTEPRCVVYWMSTAIRGHENPALDVAKAEARLAGDAVQGCSLSSVQASQ